MSQENVEIVRSIYRRGDPSRFFEVLDEQVEVDQSGFLPLPDSPERIHGRNAVIDFYRHYWGTWDDYLLEPTEIVDAGEGRVLVGHHERGRGRGSGAPFDRRWAAVMNVRAGKLVRIRFFATREDALEAAGLPG